MNGLIQDVRYAVRQLRKTPGFTVAAASILALGIGANTAIFSAVYAVLLKPLPFKDSGQLVFIRKQNPPRGWNNNPISPPEILAWRNQSGVFEDVAAFSDHSCVLTASEAAEEDACATVSSNLFSLLGVAPFRGRTFAEDEDKAESARVVLLSYGIWQRRFGGDESLIGRAITINGTSHTVVGIMPANFSRSYAPPGSPLPELWTSGIAISPIHAWNDYFGIGRLKRGIGLRQAEEQMNQVSARLERDNPDLAGWRAQVETLRAALSGGTRRALLVLMGAVVFVLLIACANLANLLLARNAFRTSEFAIRKALGAKDGRIVRQLLTESLLLSVSGGLLGILLGVLASKGVAAFATSSRLQSAPGLATGVVDWRVLAFSFVAMLATAFLFGVAPAFHSTQLDVNTALKDEGRNVSQSRRSRGFRRTLVISEVGLAMVLLVGSGLMVRTLARLSNVSLGINPANVLTLRVAFSGEQYRDPQARVEFWRRVVAGVQNLPGVESVSVSRGVQINDWAGQFFVTAEKANPPAGQVADANYVVAGPDYFRTLQIPLRSGRSFDAHDTPQSQPVAIVNAELARLQWPGVNPLGKQLRVGGPMAPWRTIVGVAGNVLSQGADAGVHSEIYIPYQQFPWLLDGPHNLLVRTSSAINPESLTRAVVEQIHGRDKEVAVADSSTLEQLASDPLQQQRVVMALLVSFAILATVLSASGVYSVLAYLIAHRTHEIGVRMALGARPVDVFGMVLKEGLCMIMSGVAVGLLGAFAITRAMASLLFGVRPTDPFTFTTVSLLLSLIALVACLVPALRAAKVDPMLALRYE